LRPLVGRFITRIRGGFRQPNQSPQSISTAGDDIQSFQQLSCNGTEIGNDMPAFRSTDQFLIDLEGIRTNDGYGYTVTIEGPSHHRRPILKKLFKKSAKLKHDSLEKEEMQEGFAITATHGPKSPGFKINTTSSYAVKEETRDPNMTPLHEDWRSSLSPEEMEQRIEDASQGLLDLSLLQTSDSGPRG
jgi:hypothetical protein